MDGLNKKSLSERDICTKFITPALVHAGWDVALQVREEVTFTDGRIIVRGQMTARRTMWQTLIPLNRQSIRCRHRAHRVVKRQSNKLDGPPG